MAIRCETYERIATYLDCMDCDLKPKCRNGKVDVVANDLTSQRVSGRIHPPQTAQAVRSRVVHNRRETKRLKKGGVK